MPPRVRRIGLGAVLLALGATLFAGLWLHTQPDLDEWPPSSDCASGFWHGQQYTRLCYSDIVPLYGTEQLQGSRIPYIDACREVENQNCDEYPVVTMFTMYLAARTAAGSYAAFFFANALL